MSCLTLKLRVGCPTSLTLFILFLGGCTSTLNSWQLQSPVDRFTPSLRLCDFRGKRLAIVPGNLYADWAKDEFYQLRSLPPNYTHCVAKGNLTITVNDSNKNTIGGGSRCSPEMMADMGRFCTQMGFVIVDREHVARILEEQDLETVFTGDAKKVGGILGADVILFVSVLQSPQVFFASTAEGAWGTTTDIAFQADCRWVAVEDGTELGSISLVAPSLLSFAGFRQIVATSVTDGLLVNVNFFLTDKNGTRTPIGSIDHSRLMHSADDAMESSWLGIWRSLCEDSAGSQ